MAILAIIAASLLIGFGGGWMVNDWRNGAEIQRLQSRDAVLAAANDQCAVDVQFAQAGVKQVTDALAAKELEADAAMKRAQLSAKKHSDLAAEIRNGPNRPGESQCDAIIREQREYVQSRAQS